MNFTFDRQNPKVRMVNGDMPRRRQMFTVSASPTPPRPTGWIRADYHALVDALEAQLKRHFVIHFRGSHTALREVLKIADRRERAWVTRRVPGGLELMECWGI